MTITSRLPLLAALVLLLTTSLPGAAPPMAAPGGPYRPPITPMTVVAPFAPPAERWLTGHRGVDLAAAPGTEVRAAGAGTVVFAGTVVDRGVVTIDHGGIRTTYEPVTAAVAVGDPVVPGTVLGVVGEGAHCSLRCLHWGARVGDDYVEPLALLTAYRPVLKTPRD